MQTQDSHVPLQRFGKFFKAYGIALGVVFAAMPLLTSAGNLLPAYEATKSTVTFSTTLLSLLAIAVLFGARRHIGQAVFPVKPGKSITRDQRKRRTTFAIATPILLAVLAVLGFIGYLIMINLSILAVAGSSSTLVQKNEMTRILSDTSIVAIPYLTPICIFYTLMFFGAATAFVWQGLVDYVQVELGISDKDLISNPYIVMNRYDFKLDDDSASSSSTPYFYFEWDSQLKNPVPHVAGPFCEVHDRKLQYRGKKDVGQYEWICVNPDKKKDAHTFALGYDVVTMRRNARSVADDLLQQELQRSL